MKSVLSCLLVALVASLMISIPTEAATYKIDREHSSISFKIRHIVSKTQGSFNQFEGSINYDPDKPKESNVMAIIDVKSIDTGVKKRDQHLVSKDFFDVTNHPKMNFKSKKIIKVKKRGRVAQLVGDLTINGITKPVVLDVVFGGIGKDPYGNERVGFTGTTVINRKDFGVDWNMEDEGGNLILGVEVEITLEIEGIRQS